VKGRSEFESICVRENLRVLGRGDLLNNPPDWSRPMVLGTLIISRAARVFVSHSSNVSSYKEYVD
jgi:hypothetical protein